jgi:hypothetical protein
VDEVVVMDGFWKSDESPIPTLIVLGLFVVFWVALAQPGCASSAQPAVRVGPDDAQVDLSAIAELVARLEAKIASLDNSRSQTGTGNSWYDGGANQVVLVVLGVLVAWRYGDRLQAALLGRIVQH